jgi:hemerythrin
MVIQELEYPLSTKIITEEQFNIDKQKKEIFYIVNSKLVSILKKMKKYDIVKDILSNKLKKIKISL